MLELLEKLTGFSKIHFSFPDIVHEFNAKFGNTIMFVNDELMEVRDISFTGSLTTPNNCVLRTTKKIIPSSDIISLKAFRPYVGIHPLEDNNFVVITKTAKKVYKKSFCWDENYSIRYYSHKTGEELRVNSSLDLCKLITIPSLKKYQGYLSQNGQIYIIQGNIFFLERLIGTYAFHDRLSLNCAFNVIDTFSQEIEDLLNKEFN